MQQSENAVVLNLLVFVCVNRLNVPFKFLVAFQSSNEAEMRTAVDPCCVGQIYVDLRHYVEIDSLAVKLEP